MPLIRPREHRDLPTELGDYIGPNGQGRKAMQLVRHVGSHVEGTSDKSLTFAQRSASRYIYVCLHFGCNLCSSAIPRLEMGMDTLENLRAHLLQIYLRMQILQSYHTFVRAIFDPGVKNDI